MVYPDIDPILVQLGPVSIHWYGVTYLIGFMGAFWMCFRRKANVIPSWTADDILDVFFYGALGVIFGGTWGYLLFYEPQLLLQEPIKILRFWDPGRSFHGGLLGVLVSFALFARVHKRRFLDVCDFLAPVIPIGLAMGRLGNFINGELWGRITEVSWGMVFPKAGSLPRHPSQLYEFALEGILLFVVLQWYSSKPRARGAVSALFLILYGLFRFIVEFWREPDLHQGFIAFGWTTMGQLLSFPMIVAGVCVFLFAKSYSYRRIQ